MLYILFMYFVYIDNSTMSRHFGLKICDAKIVKWVPLD